MGVFHVSEFDIKRFLDENNVSWRGFGHKSVSANCEVGVNCPFCKPPDDGYHCGVFKESYNYSCFKCGAAGPLYRLLKELSGISFSEFKTYVDVAVLPRGVSTSKYLRDKFYLDDDEPEKIKKVCLPRRSKRLTVLNDFISGRGYSSEYLKKYRAYPCHFGKFKNRIILPVYDVVGNRVSFQARDMSLGKYKSNWPYLNPKFPFRDHLYWLHTQKKHIKNTGWLLLVEGIFDRWGFGVGSVATFKNSITPEQINLLIDNEVQDLYIGWDDDSFDKAVKTAENIRALFNSVRVLSLPYKQDPDILGRRKMLEFMKIAEQI